MTAGTTVQAPDGTEVVLGEIGTRVLLENQRVRVWEVALEAGEAQGWHLHHNPYVVLCLATSPCHMDWLDGSAARELSETVGGSVYRPVSPIHMLTNDGDSPYLNRLIELLDLGEEAGGAPYDAAGITQQSGFDQPGEIPTKTVVDDPDVRVQHVTTAPGETYTWRTGPHPTLVIDLDLTNPTVTYLNPGDSHTLPIKPTQTNGFNLVELLYYAR
ncbi:hypothetical protein F1D05_18050 [Kribbella qitaiheensis]|uniref:Cupin domain-containing protein n=1 Tax=Kribbella qitaiheensis TaxID=1544730 RepID=A0A7G6WZQ3_9ACTN|nr:hypothetical protein [Kribbella qitaiheensis]QNE19468.1 hypothetical protein F1D05_18050 [Kribbella qitaiheensis]